MVSAHIAVIGAGSIGRRHAANLTTLGCTVSHLPWRSFDAEAFAAVGIDPTRRAEDIPVADYVRLANHLAG